jgi:hypothetical protein
LRRASREKGSISFFAALFLNLFLTSEIHRAYTSTGDKRRVLLKADRNRPRVCSPGGVRLDDPSDRTAAPCLGVHSNDVVAPIRAAVGSVQPTTGRSDAATVAASAAGRPSGRVGRLLGNSALPASTAATIVAGVQVSLFSHRRITHDRRHRECSPRRVCHLMDVLLRKRALTRHKLRGPK